MPIDVHDHPYLFSTGTLLAYNIDNDCYGGKHFVWCALSCNSRSQAASSNPFTIARRLIEDVFTLDEHSDKINQNIAGILNGAKTLYNHRVIDNKTRKRVNEIVKHAVRSDFLPVIYVINTHKVNSRIIEVPPIATARRLSPEYKLTDLHDGEFELINVAQLIFAATEGPGRC